MMGYVGSTVDPDIHGCGHVFEYICPFTVSAFDVLKALRSSVKFLCNRNLHAKLSIDFTGKVRAKIGGYDMRYFSLADKSDKDRV